VKHFAFFLDAEQQTNKIIAFMLAPLGQQCAEVFRQIEQTFCAARAPSIVPVEFPKKSARASDQI
jgi:hypothetical protein